MTQTIALQLRLRQGPQGDRPGRLKACGELIEGSAKGWFQAAYEGAWLGHHQGPFEFNSDTFGSILRNFENRRNPIQLTYEHPETWWSGAAIPAAGWIHDMELRGSELWVFAEYTGKAADLIRSGEYRWCSVCVDWEATDIESGEDLGPVIFEVGLVGSPALQGMSPVRLSSDRTHRLELVWNEDERMKVDVKKILEEAKAAGYQLRVDRIALADKTLKQLVMEVFRELGDDNPPRDKLFQALEAKDVLAKIMSGEEGGETAPPADGAASTAAGAGRDENDLEEGLGEPGEVGDEMAIDAGMVGDALAMTLGTDLAGALAFIETELPALMGGGDATPMSDKAKNALEAGRARISALNVQLKKRDKRIDELEKKYNQLQAGRVDDRLDRAIEAGHILDSDRGKFRKLAESSPELLDEWLGDAEKNPAVPQRKLGSPPSEHTRAEADEKPDEEQPRSRSRRTGKARPKLAESDLSDVEKALLKRQVERGLSKDAVLTALAQRRGRRGANSIQVEV